VTATEDFMAHLLREAPGLSEKYREHKAANDQILPHVLMGDLARLALELSGQSKLPQEPDACTLTQLLDALESGMCSTSAAVKELIAVSFLENLSEDEPNYPSLARRLGPALAQEMTRLHGGDP
jgi:hypothetical protein